MQTYEKNNKEIRKLKTFLITSGSIITPLSAVAFLVACHEKEQPKKEIEQKPNTSLDSTKETITPEFPSFKTKIHFLVNINMKKHP
ncbi:hypothetical protein [Mesomycoplasma ovipneumoniae]|uniref:hypothetical protein n=1 Tax=Mesomycoplasma ovipneumoniae TaxID=29562 RepID=UPI00311ADB61